VERIMVQGLAFEGAARESAREAFANPRAQRKVKIAAATLGLEFA
jgi:hypothetical protein